MSIAKPGRDTNASPIEEVFVEARAEDDFGVRDLELVYSVNGSAEKTIRLFDGKNRLAEVTAGHTFYLEELNVKAGDFVSYYARAADNDTNGAKRQSSDIYFLQIRPAAERVQARRVRCGRRRWWRRRRRPGRRALAAAAADRRGDVQRQPRSQDDVGRQAARELGRARAVAGEAARPGRWPADEDEQPADPAGPVVQESRGTAPAGRRGDEERRGEAAESRSAGRARARTESAADPAARRRRVPDAGADGAPAVAAAVAVAARAPWPRIWPICSSSSSTRWPTSTRRRSARNSSSPISRSTSSSRS